MSKQLVVDLNRVSMKDTAEVGEKNASLGELIVGLTPVGVQIPEGFATTCEAYRDYLARDGLKEELIHILSNLPTHGFAKLERCAIDARNAVLSRPLSEELKSQIFDSYDALCRGLGCRPEMAVRSSATVEDLPGGSFAHLHATFLNVQGREEVVCAVHHCYASMFNDRAIDYRNRNGLDHMRVALSVGVQPMVRSDLSSSGVISTFDAESALGDVVVVSGSYGLGETLFQGGTNPDEWTVFKTTLKIGFSPVASRRLGTKLKKLVYESNSGGTRVVEVPERDRAHFCLDDTDVLKLASWACLIEDHYAKLAGRPQTMNLEWAKDGKTGRLHILQAGPKIHSWKTEAMPVMA